MGLSLPDTDFSVEEEEEKDAGKKSDKKTDPAPTFLDNSRALKKDLENYYTGPPAWTETRYGIFKAFGRLGNAFVTKDDFRNYTLGTLMIGSAPIVGALSLAPATIALPTASTTYGAAVAAENIVDAIDPGPPSTLLGGLKTAFDYLNDMTN